MHEPSQPSLRQSVRYAFFEGIQERNKNAICHAGYLSDHLTLGQDASKCT